MRFTLSKKLSLGFFIILTLLLLIAISSVYELSKLKSNTEEVVFLERKSKIFSKIAYGSRTLLSVSDFIITGNIWIYDYYLPEARVVNEQIENFSELQLSERDRSSIDKIEQAIFDLNLFNHNLIKRDDKEIMRDWNNLVSELDTKSKVLTTNLDVLSNNIDKELNEAQLIASKVEKSTFVMMVIISGLALITCFFVARRLDQLITKPITRLLVAIKKVIKGDFAHRIEIHSNDEVGDLANSFNLMGQHLQKSEKEQQKLVNSLESSNNQLKNEIKERKNKELELIKSEANLTIAQKIAKLGSCEYDFRSKEFSISNEVFRIFELIPENHEFLGTEKLIVCLPDLADVLKQSFADKFKKKDTIEYDYDMVMPDQSLKLLNVTEKVFYNKKGKVTRFVRTFVDMTKIRATEQRLKSINKELNTFIYKASHDLKGPLSSVLGLTYVAKTEVKDKVALKYIKMIENCNNRLDTILMGLLSLTKISQGTLATNKVNLNGILNEVIESLKHTPRYKKIKCKINIDPDFELKSDENLLKSVFQNLVENAMKYSRNGKNRPYINISLSETQKGARIKIADNGVGIPETTKDKIFDMFFRGHTKSQGSGLGLYIVKNAIEKLKGNIQVESKEGEGSTFTIFLPDLNLKNIPQLNPLLG